MTVNISRNCSHLDSAPVTPQQPFPRASSFAFAATLPSHPAAKEVVNLRVSLSNPGFLYESLHIVKRTFDLPTQAMRFIGRGPELGGPPILLHITAQEVGEQDSIVLSSPYNAFLSHGPPQGTTTHTIPYRRSGGKDRARMAAASGQGTAQDCADKIRIILGVGEETKAHTGKPD